MSHKHRGAIMCKLKQAPRWKMRCNYQGGALPCCTIPIFFTRSSGTVALDQLTVYGVDSARPVPGFNGDSGSVGRNRRCTNDLNKATTVPHADLRFA